MKMTKMDGAKIIFIYCFVIVLSYETKPEKRRHRRYSPHPAFTMFNTGMGRMTFPGFALSPSLNGGMSSYSLECIRDDIVCPAYCIMEDEWGCKSCPCGPANGMSPARVHTQSKHTESKHDCMGTILCMLTCKDGYRLGQGQENGCQTCTCKKKNESKNNTLSAAGNQQGTDCTGPACSAKNGGETSASPFHRTDAGLASASSSTKSQTKECKWPLCMAGSTSGSNSGSAGGSNSGSAGGNIAGSTSGSITGSAGGSIAGSAGRSNSGSAGGSIAGSKGGNIAGSIGGSIAGSAGGSITGSKGGSITGSISGSIAGSAGGIIAGSTGGSRAGSTGGGIAGSAGGSNAGTNGQLRDCTGPSCSAVNGMRLMSQRFPSVPTKPTPGRIAAEPHSCQATEICKKTCKYTVQLGREGPEGCRACLCVMTARNGAQTTTEAPMHGQCHKAMTCMISCSNGYQLGPETETNGCPLCTCLQVPTTREPKPVFLMPVTPRPLVQPTPAPCQEVTHCMRTCRYGYQIESSHISTECPRCRCIMPLTPPPPTTRKPNFMMLLRTCHEPLKCMKTCPNGYTLQTENDQACPVCRCNPDRPAVILRCTEPLSCPQGCTVGYRCDALGCPTCDCIQPSETKLTVQIHTSVIQSTLKCLPNFSCGKRCDFGYKTGDNGCPTCRCLEHVTVQFLRPSTVSPYQFVTQAPPFQTITQGLPLLSSNQIMPPLPGYQKPLQSIHASGIGCLGPACSAPGARVPVSNFHVVNSNSPNTKYYGVGALTGHGNNFGVSPGSLSIAHMPGTSTLHLPGPDQQSSASSSAPTLQNIIKMCSEIARCLEVCEHGFDIGIAQPGNCPPCKCLDGETKNQTPVDVTPDTSTITTVAEKSGALIQQNQESVTTERIPTTAEALPSVIEACPETVNCMIGCQGPYNLTTSGSRCPVCTCLEKASTCEEGQCSSNLGLNQIPTTTPSPGECLAILHCVLTCERGYDVGEVGRDGCPSCQCVE